MTRSCSSGGPKSVSIRWIHIGPGSSAEAGGRRAGASAACCLAIARRDFHLSDGLESVVRVVSNDCSLVFSVGWVGLSLSGIALRGWFFGFYTSFRTTLTWRSPNPSTAPNSPRYWWRWMTGYRESWSLLCMVQLPITCCAEAWHVSHRFVIRRGGPSWEHDGVMLVTKGSKSQARRPPRRQFLNNWARQVELSFHTSLHTLNHILSSPPRPQPQNITTDVAPATVFDLKKHEAMYSITQRINGVSSVVLQTAFRTPWPWLTLSYSFSASAFATTTIMVLLGAIALVSLLNEPKAAPGRIDVSDVVV